MQHDYGYTDRELMQRVAEGDRDAFAEVYDRSWNTIYATALSYLKSPEWAQDVVQDIFLKVWTGREKLREVEKPDAYLFILARNELVSALRNKFDCTPISEKYEDYLPGDCIQPDKALSLKETTELIEQAVEQLPPQQKLVYNLTRKQELSHESIAKELGLNTRTVNNHATRALNLIRRYLKDHGGILLILISRVFDGWK